MLRYGWITVVLLSGFMLSGCRTVPEEVHTPAVVQAQYAAAPVKVDGKLDDAVWYAIRPMSNLSFDTSANRK